MLPFAKTLIVLPTYNEAQNITAMLKALKEISSDLHMLIIDDGSPDGTADAVREIQKSNPNVHLIEREGKLGLGTAYIKGFKWGLENGYEFIFSMDSDFSHEIAAVPKMLEAAQTHDLVVGSRYVGGIRIINWPLKRLLLSSFASFYVRTITGMPLTDPCAGYNCFTKKALESIDLDHIKAVGYNFLVEIKYMIWNRDFKITEVPIIFSERREGVSKMSKSVIFEAVFNVLKLKARKIFKKL